MQSCLQRAPTGGPRGASAGSRLCAQVGDLMNWSLSTVNLSTVPTFFVLRTAAQFLGRTKEKKRKEKKRKEKKRKEKKFWHQYNEQPKIIPGCPKGRAVHGCSLLPARAVLASTQCPVTVLLCWLCLTALHVLQESISSHSCGTTPGQGCTLWQSASS